ncbi:unnamed protein product [Phytomonas sp. EM1]|nr:unnamed protein product [Phytomonas sp. EM1]|eukprot:CCW63089.1 unnamed protein product [Phytomonas sp. isolate EM1]
MSDTHSDDINQSNAKSTSVGSSIKAFHTTPHIPLAASASTTHRVCRPLYSDGQIGLRKAAWLRMDPVSKWTTLVDLARRGPYLLEEGDAERKETSHLRSAIQKFFSAHKGSFQKKKAPSDVLGQEDDRVHFTKTSTRSHALICQALPYAARLHLALSLLLWLRCLRDVQDTFARLQMPFAHTTRLRTGLLSQVFPTRLMEHWVDPFTCVSVGMSDTLNGTGEQVPAPHTWDPETAETIDDDVLELTWAVGDTRAPHGQCAVSRTEVLNRVQGLTPRPSADDERVARVVGVRSNRKQRRRQLLARQDRRNPHLSTAANPDGRDVNSAAQSGKTTAQWSNGDSNRALPPSPLESNPLEDAYYHGNTDRGEGCPFSDYGTLSSCPIHIPGSGNMIWEGCGGTVGISNTALEVEATLGRCVQAHVAILSSLFIEGRVAQFTTTDPVVYHYVFWLFEELIRDKYLFSELIQGKGKTVSMQLMPYYPPWCFRSVLILLPPATERITKSDASNLAGLILRAAPCDVLVETIPSIDTDGNGKHEIPNRGESGEKYAMSYVAQVQEEVDRQRRVLLKVASRKDQLHISSSDEAKAWRVSWVPLRAHPSNDSNHMEGTQRVESNEAYSQTSNASKGSFTFVLNQEHADIDIKNSRGNLRTYFSNLLTSCVVGMINWLASAYQRWNSKDGDAESAKQLQRGERFIEEVSGAVQDRVHALQLLYLPHNSMLPKRHLQDWVWQRLPGNVRLVGVNTSPWDTLFFFPQAPFLSHKAGNAFRFRAVERVVVAKHAAAFGVGPLRSLTGRSFWLRGGKKWERVGLHARLNSLDRARLSKLEYSHKEEAETISEESSEKVKIIMGSDNDKVMDVLVTERAVEYLANPSKLTWFALFSAIIFHL